MEESVQQFVERMGIICEKEGMARSAGRIFGLLLVSGRPYSLDELAEKLQQSKASVSTNCRMLEQLGFLQRVGSLGDRRDFYRAEADPWERMLRVAQTRWRDMQQVFALEGRRRMLEAERFHEMLIEGCDRLLEDWRQVRAEIDAAPDAA